VRERCKPFAAAIPRRLALATVCVAICASSLGAETTLSERLRRLVAASAQPNAVWTVSVRDCDTGQSLADLNADTPANHASNLKLVTTAAVLATLGPDYVFETRVWGEGERDGDVWQGHVFVVGSGDPSISGRFHDGAALHVFDRFAEQLLAKGVRTIDGDLVGDDSFFDDRRRPGAWEVADLTYYYAPEISALSFNENCIDLTVTASGAVGAAPRTSHFPFDTDYVKLMDRQTITPAGSEFQESYRRVLGSNTIVLASRLPQGHVETESLTIADPALFFVDTLKKRLASRGVAVRGKVRTERRGRSFDWAGRGVALLAVHRSPPLSRLLTAVNKRSSNLYAEMMLKTVAAERSGASGSTWLGIQALEEVYRQFGGREIVAKDGSGMAAASLLTSGGLTAFLVNVRGAPYFPAFRDSLSVGGVDGTLGKRFKTGLKGRVRGKSGTISGARAVSGYLDAVSGRTLAFSIVTNHFICPRADIDAVHEKIVELLDETP